MIEAKLAPLPDVEKVLFDPEIYDRITDDNSPPADECKLDYSKMFLIGSYLDGEIAALTMVHNNLMHFMVLKRHRKHARELLKAFIEFWPYEIFCKIPSLYPEVINFAKNNGFKEVIVYRETYLKNGKIYDEHMLHYQR